MLITNKESYALCVIRWITCIMIVVCHILQGLNNKWAWYLNVGVQIFFFLSGFIYGIKKVGPVRNFYYKRFLKIYIPYWALVSLGIILLFIFSPHSLSVKQVIGQYLLLNTFTGNIPGLNHLWFMPVIVGCYVILPFFEKAINRSPKWSICIFFSLLVIVSIFHYHPYVLWAAVYFIGYVCGRYKKSNIFILLSAVFTFLLVKCNIISLTPGIQSDVLHAAGAIVCFLIIFKLLLYLPEKQTFAWIWGGYLIYLSHHQFILGPLSILHLTPKIPLNIIMIVLLTMVWACIIEKVSNGIIRRFPS